LFTIIFTNAQNSTMAPDSASTGPLSGSNANWNFTNPLNHNGTSFGNFPTIVCLGCRSNILYLQNMGFSIPAGSTIQGIEVIYERGGCNGGSYVYDSIYLMNNATVFSQASYYFVLTPDVGGTDTLGGPSDTWSAALTPAIVNSIGFGVRIAIEVTGICTYGVFDCRVIVYLYQSFRS
jgi:hypothetical protein